MSLRALAKMIAKATSALNAPAHIREVHNEAIAYLHDTGPRNGAIDSIVPIHGSPAAVKEKRMAVGDLVEVRTDGRIVTGRVRILDAIGVEVCGAILAIEQRNVRSV